MIFPANLLTGAKYPELNIISTKNNTENITTKTTIKEKLLTYVQTETNEIEACFN